MTRSGPVVAQLLAPARKELTMSSKRRVGCFAAMVGCQLCIAGTAATQGPAIGAQPDQTAEAPPAPKGKKSGEEEIIVTGSRLRRKDLTTPAPVTVINREQVLASGRVSIGDFLQTLPQQGNALNTSVNNGGNGSTRVSLRSLGAARTLVLLNGRRMVPGGNGADDSVDLNSIPSAAIEQIEVLRDGASAVYGSDAIGGVVNLITRKRMNGAEVSGVAGTSTHSDGTIYDLNALAGTSGERGNLLFTAGFYTQKPVMSGDRTFSARGLAYDASGSRTTTGLPGPYSQGSSTVPQGTVIISSAQAGIARPNPNNDPRIDFYNRLITMNPSRTVFIRDPNAAPGRLPNGDTAVCSAREPGQCYRPYATFASGVVGRSPAAWSTPASETGMGTTQRPRIIWSRPNSVFHCTRSAIPNSVTTPAPTSRAPTSTGSRIKSGQRCCSWGTSRGSWSPRTASTTHSARTWRSCAAACWNSGPAPSRRTSTLSASWWAWTARCPTTSGP